MNLSLIRSTCMLLGLGGLVHYPALPSPIQGDESHELLPVRLDWECCNIQACVKLLPGSNLDLTEWKQLSTAVQGVLRETLRELGAQRRFTTNNYKRRVAVRPGVVA